MDLKLPLPLKYHVLKDLTNIGELLVELLVLFPVLHSFDLEFVQETQTNTLEKSAGRLLWRKADILDFEDMCIASE